MKPGAWSIFRFGDYRAVLTNIRCWSMAHLNKALNWTFTETSMVRGHTFSVAIALLGLCLIPYSAQAGIYEPPRHEPIERGGTKG